MVSHGLIDKQFLLWDVFLKITCSLGHNDVINCQSLVYYIKMAKLLSIAIDRNRQRNSPPPPKKINSYTFFCKIFAVQMH